MLGFDHKKTIIVKEPYATQIREKLLRYRKGEFTEEEIKGFEKQKEISKKYKAIWEDV